ncbi:hypothetical protein P7K49_026775 [Saguinus oedipus]|uniref:Uncharacterized protein n=1 Tax=Saguinus oedipus TaxID=9490 RepID=A0ABQ9UE76_SAGOE|nr:hypothetical protein P7K49_026775 [Saguinus oedipus]
MEEGSSAGSDSSTSGSGGAQQRELERMAEVLVTGEQLRPARTRALARGLRLAWGARTAAGAPRGWSSVRPRSASGWCALRPRLVAAALCGAESPPPNALSLFPGACMPPGLRADNLLFVRQESKRG